MDDRNAKKIYQHLEILETKDKDNFHLLKDQVTIVKSSFDKIQKLILENQKRIQEIQNFTDQLVNV